MINNIKLKPTYAHMSTNQYSNKDDKGQTQDQYLTLFKVTKRNF